MTDENAFHLKITNESNESRKAYLFGRNKGFQNENYGSEKGVKVESMDGEYLERVSSSANIPCRICLVRLQAEDREQFQNDIFIVQEDAIGQKFQAPLLVPNVDLTDTTRFLKTLLDVAKDFVIDGNTHLWLDMKPNSTLIVTLFKKL